MLKKNILNTKINKAAASATDIIDWETCVSLCLGDEAFTYQMLSTFAQDLKNTQSILNKAYAEQDTKTLLAELHRTLGGICYLKLPELTHNLTNFQEAIKASPKDPAKLASTYSGAQDAMKHFWETWHEYTKK